MMLDTSNREARTHFYNSQPWREHRAAAHQYGALAMYKERCENWDDLANRRYRIIEWWGFLMFWYINNYDTII